MTLAESVDLFIDALRFEREMSENTCAAYARDLRAFAADAQRRGVTGPADVTRAHIAEFLRGEREQGLAASTRARRTVAIRMWLKDLKARRLIAHDPTELLDAPKKAKTLPKVLSEEEVFRLLDEVKGTTPRDLRDRALLEVLYGCGLRVSEACALTRDDIVAEGELVRILGKGSKERLVPIGGAAGRALRSYCESARDTFTKGRLDVNELFVTRLGKPFTRQGVFKVIRERAAAVGIAADRISPHVLRHCFASHMLQHGADIRAIQELLGHADIGTTQIYTHVDARRFADIHRQHHPRAT